MLQWIARLWQRVAGLVRSKPADVYRPSNLHGRHR